MQIIGDASSLSRAFGQAGKASSGFGSKLGSVAKYAGLAVGGAALGGLAVVLRQGTAEFSQHAKVAAQTAAVLKSTGGAASVTAKQVDRLASSVMRYSGMDDEAVQAGENMLLTFTNVQNRVGKTNDIFNQATRATADMAVAMGMDMTKAALQVGKALNDPVKGMTKLQRIGVTFTDGQKKAVAEMVKLGDTAGAQKVILAELTKEFGGSAKAVGDTLPGQINKLKETFNNLAGDVVAKLVPSFQSIVTWTTANMPTIEAVFGAVFGAIGSAIRALTPVFDLLVQGVGVVVGYVRANWPQISAIFNQVKDVVVAAITLIVSRVQKDWPHIQQTIQQAMAAIKDIVTGVVNILQAIWGKFGDTITAIARTVFNALGPIVRNALNIVVGIFQAIGDLLHGRWGELWGDIKKIVSNALSGVVTIIKTTLSVVYQAAIAIGKALIDGIVAGLANLAQTVGDSIWHQVKAGIANAKHELGIKSPSTFTRNEIGVPLAQGVIAGWNTGIGGFGNIVSDNLNSQLIQAAQNVRAVGLKMLKETMAEAVGGPTALGDATNYLAMAAQQAANAQTLSDYTSAVYDTSFATPGYSVGMSPSQVYALSKSGGDTYHVTVNAGLGTNPQVLEQAVIKALANADARGTVRLAMS